MKTKLKLAFIALVAFSVNSFSQKSVSKSISNDNDKVKIHIEKDENGKKEIFDREYNVVGMSENERQELIDRVTDSLSVGSGKEMRMRVKVDRNMADNENNKGKKGKKRVEIYRKGDSDKNNDENVHIDIDGEDIDLGDLDNLGQRFNIEIDKMKPMLKGFSDQMEPMMKSFGDQFGNSDSFSYFDNNSNSSKTVKGLKAYPNKPSNNRLNIRFETPEKGDVTITVTDLVGKVIGQEKVKDFNGEYMSQIDLKGNIKGTVFVTVVQGNDGTVKRVVIE